MLFNSIEFLVFLPLVLLSYSALKQFRVSLLLLASYFFYGWWNWSYLMLIIFSTCVDYFCAKEISKQTIGKRRKSTFLLISILFNLGILGFFKYYNFFGSELNELFEYIGMNYLIPLSDFLLPIGISFYTFQTLSYTMDVYNGKVEYEKNVFNFALYVSFFPQLVAGPIERPKHLIGQLKNLKSLASYNIKEGFYRITFGLFKKLVIADRLALFVNQVYANPENYDGSLLLIATLFFAFQIYCDFSGYSDIAIGTAKLFGVDLMENFKNPYFSRNIREFWSRWHISLSTWFRDYLYIPLGGNRQLHLRNIILVFLISGLWHGANWTFIVWGGLHGFYFLLQQLSAKLIKLPKSNISRLFKTVITFCGVCFAWVFFRSNNVHDAFYIISKFTEINFIYLKDMAYQIKVGILEPGTLTKAFNINFGEFYFQSSVGDIILSFILIPALLLMESRRQNKNFTMRENYRSVLYLILAVSIVLFGVFSENQFIYFQF